MNGKTTGKIAIDSSISRRATFRAAAIIMGSLLAVVATAGTALAKMSLKTISSALIVRYSSRRIPARSLTAQSTPMAGVVFIPRNPLRTPA